MGYKHFIIGINFLFFILVISLLLVDRIVSPTYYRFLCHLNQGQTNLFYRRAKEFNNKITQSTRVIKEVMRTHLLPHSVFSKMVYMYIMILDSLRFDYFFGKSHDNSCCLATRECKVNDHGHA